MSNSADTSESRQLLERFARAGLQDRSEISVIASPGARVAAWAVKVKSLSEYNVYNVRVVEIGAPGSLPVEIGSEMQAVNLAESFLANGQLSAGTYAVMFRVGGANIFYVQV